MSTPENSSEGCVKNNTLNNETFLPPNTSVATPDNSIVRSNYGNILDSSDDTTFNGEEISIALENGFLRFKPLKYLFKACNDKELESRITDKSIGNPFKTKFLHDFLLYFLLYRSDLMLMSCASDADKWNKEKMEDNQNLRSNICNAHKKLKEYAGMRFIQMFFRITEDTTTFQRK